jgi:hypothetical protein
MRPAACMQVTQQSNTNAVHIVEKSQWPSSTKDRRTCSMHAASSHANNLAIQRSNSTSLPSTTRSMLPLSV